MSTAFHPQTNGQRERLNQTIEAYLQSFISYEQDDWVSLLPMAEFAYNNSITNTTGISPFYANYRFHPNTMNPTAVLPLNSASFAYGHWMHAVAHVNRKCSTRCGNGCADTRTHTPKNRRHIRWAT